MIRYDPADDILARALDIAARLGLDHIDPEGLYCVRSVGSRSRRILARCHALPRIMQTALQRPAAYVIEVVSERFERLTPEDQTRVLIHELMHIPRSFGGGLLAHRPHVTARKVEALYRKFIKS
jgi:predicted metallopeptidase